MAKRGMPSSKDEVAGSKKRKTTFPIVGLGSSAGGLEVIETFFRNLPPDTGMAFVIVTHLDPRHPSLLADIVSKSTAMEVVQIENEMVVQKNTVYVIPPGKEMIIIDGILRLFQRGNDNEPFMPIDVFLRSLAEDLNENAIAVILSGNGSDGSLGLRSIHSNLGMIMVQSPEGAKYDSMPRSAIGTGLADYVLPPAEMPGSIIKYVNSLKAGSRTRIAEPDKGGDDVHRILSLLKGGTGQDFSHYKKSTINRRIERRMSVHQLKNMAQYATYLASNSKEIQLLFKELTIEVTGFFRNPKAFDSLKKTLRKTLFDSNEGEGASRIWVAGCSTGEEVYSIGIILSELKEETGKRRRFQIFGSDINEEAVSTARNGLYPLAITKDVGTRRLEKNFIREEAGYRIRKEIREMIIFATHNVVQDPPFLRVDLISCRNLLIYFEPVLQKKAIGTFSAALNPNGILFLGESETIGGFESEFITIDQKMKLYRRRAYIQRRLSKQKKVQSQKSDDRTFEETKPVKVPSLSGSAEKILLSEHTPPSLIINNKNEVIYFHGRTSKYLEHTSGRATLGIQDMLRQDIRYVVMSAIGESRRTNKKIVSEAVLADPKGGVAFLNVIVRPLEEFRSISGIMVVFDEIDIPKKIQKRNRGSVASRKNETRIDALEKELAYTKENLQHTVEKLETSNEELTSINEELQSSNEEMQSGAEESLTAKEELNSLNEELMTVNAELERKNQELMLTSGDMRNLLNGVDVATIFLDIDLKIRRYTSQTALLMNLLPTDVGRPIQDIAMNLRYDDLVKDVKEVVETLNTTEKEIQTKDGLWFNLKILPYRTVENVIDGVVITFTSIDTQKKTQERLEDLSSKIEAAREYADSIINTVKEPLLVLDQDLIVQFANLSFHRIFEAKEDEVKGRSLDQILDGTLNTPLFISKLRNLKTKDTELENLKIAIVLPKSGKKEVNITARKLILAKGKSTMILITVGM
jgi:two-component system CheB/CheR fusion protein